MNYFIFKTLSLIGTPHAFAAVGSIQELITEITKFVGKYLTPLIITLAFAAFLYGVLVYFIRVTDDIKKREEGRKYMIWGIIALFVMFSLWGILKIINTTFGVTNIVPQIQEQ
jgi:hypothetical protein